MQEYSTDKCDQLLGEIPADVAPLITWGPQGQAGIDKALPSGWELSPFNCRLNVWGAFGNHNVRDQMSFYEVWTAGVMMAGVCARYGKPGKYEHL
ncbi:MAG: hypothetical protein Q9201_006550, partial [Fulgogasparrea decipioides]